MLIYSGLALHAQRFESLASTPSGGWKGRNKLDGKINEQIIKEIAGTDQEKSLIFNPLNH